MKKKNFLFNKNRYRLLVLSILVIGIGFLLMSGGASDNPEVSILASGSEVEIALEAQEKLKAMNINSKVISITCYDIFQNQTESYKDEMFGKNKFKISIEASTTSGWKSTVGKDGVSLGLTTFGRSAPFKDIYKLFNLTSDEIVKITKSKVGK